MDYARRSIRMDLEIDVSQCGEVKLVREAQNFEAAPPAQSSSAYREKFWVSISFFLKKKTSSRNSLVHSSQKKQMIKSLHSTRRSICINSLSAILNNNFPTYLCTLILKSTKLFQSNSRLNINAFSALIII